MKEIDIPSYHILQNVIIIGLKKESYVYEYT